MAGADNCVTTAEAATEIIAVHLFAKAYDDGVVATRRWIDNQLTRLRSHTGGCPCSAPCHLAARVTGNKVHWTVQGWQRQYRISKVRARR